MMALKSYSFPETMNPCFMTPTSNSLAAVFVKRFSGPSESDCRRSEIGNAALPGKLLVSRGRFSGAGA